MKKKKKYWSKTFTIKLAEDIKLVENFRMERGKAKGFSLILRKRFANKWYTIRRWDNTPIHHSIPHCHHYKKGTGKKHRELIGEENSDIGKLVREITDHIKENYTKIVNNYIDC